jgi:hypothetical protein
MNLEQLTNPGWTGFNEIFYWLSDIVAVVGMTVAIGVDMFELDDITAAAIGRMEAIARGSVTLLRTGWTERTWICCEAIGRMFALRNGICCSADAPPGLIQAKQFNQSSVYNTQP